MRANDSGTDRVRIATVFWCCICKRPSRGWKCNPWPLKPKGFACEECDAERVLPARLAQAKAD